MGDGLASALSGAYKAVQFIFKLTATHEDTHIVHEQLRGLDSATTRLKALRSDPKANIEQAQKERISNVLHESYILIDRIAKPVEKSRVDEKVYGTTTLWHRITWELRDEDTVAKYQPLITQYLGSLREEIAILELEQRLRAHVQSEDEPSPGRLLRQSTLGKRLNSQRQEESLVDSQSLEDDHSPSQNDWVRWLNNDDLVRPKHRKKRRTKELKQERNDDSGQAQDASKKTRSGLGWMSRDLPQLSNSDKRRRSGAKSGSSTVLHSSNSDDD